MSELSVSSARHVTASEQSERAIARASSRTGVDFGYLLAQARIESGLDSKAKSPTSSASGLYQFVEQTWLETMQRHGARHGLGEFAAAIEQRAGSAHVGDPVMRERILALRNDPAIAAVMAGELAGENHAHLSQALGRAPDAGELYLAHFLGPAGAERFLKRLAREPAAPAAGGFAEAASSNRAIFYAPSGNARSYAEVMQLVRGKLSAASGQALQSSLGTLPAAPTVRLPMSELIQRGFEADERPAAGSQALAHARRAYERLKAFGL